MRKGSTVIDQDVFSVSDGTRLETVTDLVINEANDAIIALLIDTGGLMSSSKVIPVSSIHRFGPSAVMVENADVIVEADDIPEVNDILEREDSVLGSRVVTHEGDDLGEIKDMYFDEKTGQIRGFEVSGGRVGDLMEGTSYLKLEQVNTVGPDAVIAQVEAREVLARQRGGVAGALDTAREKADEASGTLKEKADEAGGTLKEGAEGARGKLEEAGDKARSTAEEAGDPDGTLVGRWSREDVTDGTGSVIVANGERIELDHVHEARDAGKTDDLYRAAGVKREKSAGDQAKEAAEEASASASDLWDRFTTKLSELTDATGQRVDGEMTKRRLGQINDAIGRPVTKVFLDREDNVILDLGDLVTHQSVQRAHDNGMLDSLLDSVYTAEVTFERDELRAQMKGDSVVEEASGGAKVVDDLERHKEETESGGGDDGSDSDSDKGSEGQSKTGGPKESSSKSDRPGPGAQGAPMTSDAPATTAAATSSGASASASQRTGGNGERS